jgi:formylglycine-generating enzyme required for sulfatase activity
MSVEESYRALGLEPGAGLQEVRRSYYRLVKFFHPDRHQGSPGLQRKATEETKKLNLAYELVCKAVAAGRRSGPHAPARGPARRSRPGPPPVAGREYIVPSSGARLLWVAPGRFAMGSPPGEAGRSEDEGPQTDVTISRGFWLGIFSVTQEQWSELAEHAPGIKAEPSFFRGTNLPVEQVSWDDCQAWLRELNAIEEAAGRVPAGCQYRLPTEAEWEFACRAGTSTRFHFGDGDAPLADHAWHSTNSGGQTHPAGAKKPNAWGFFDMHGNVWEWCQDRYGPLSRGAVSDPSGPPLGLNRVFRGGSWGVQAARCRSAYRVWNAPGYRDYTVGFRLALGPSL